MYKRKIKELVGENYIFASVLHYFGMKFYEYSDKTLEQVCLEKGLSVNAVIHQLESVSQLSGPVETDLVEYPLELVLEYLKHTHHLFVKQRLPYLADLIFSCKPDKTGYSLVIKDLQLVFPLFVEDFIKHIYEEEDELFTYISMLNDALHNKVALYSLFSKLDSYKLQEHALEHHVHEDEMAGIRRITHDYNTTGCDNLHISVIYKEMKSFEQALHTHARIENEILFPKALQLESKVKQLFAEKIALN